MHLLREKILLSAVEKELRLDMLKLRQQQATAAISSPSAELASEQFIAANEDWYEIGRRSLPFMNWPKPITAKLEESDVDQYKTAWEATFGVKMDGPEVKAYAAQARMKVPKIKRKKR